MSHSSHSLPTSKLAAMAAMADLPEDLSSLLLDRWGASSQSWFSPAVVLLYNIDIK